MLYIPHPSDPTPRPQSRIIDLPAGRFHYLTWNVDRTDLPSFILLHGITSSARSWMRVGAALADRYRVYALDMRGHGDSVKPAPGPYSLYDTATDAAAFMQSLSLKNSILLGHSWGGATALILATKIAPQQPELTFSKIILEDPAHTFGKGDPIQRASRFVVDIGRPEEELRAELLRLNPDWSTADIEAKMDANSKVSYETVLSVFTEAGKQGELLPLFRELPAPTLLLRADSTLGSTFTDAAWEEVQRLLSPSSHAVQIPGATHNMHRNRFGAFMQAINIFLAGSYSL